MPIPKKKKKNKLDEEKNVVPDSKGSIQAKATSEEPQTDSKMVEFRAFVMPMILDSYLDISEENDSMKKAAALGLNHMKAQRELERLCELHDAILERTAKKKYKEEVRDEVGDKFLDEEEEQTILQKGLKIFVDAEEPMKLVKDLIETVLSEENAMSETQFRSDIDKMLDPHKAQGSTISKDSWEQICLTILKRAEKKSIDTEVNDLRSILNEVLENNGLTISTSSGKGMNMILAIVALLVFAGLAAYLNKPPEITGPDGNKITQDDIPNKGASSVDLPTCDDDCAKNLQILSGKLNKAAQNDSFLTPIGKSVCTYEKKIDSLCKDFNGLSPKGKRLAEQKYPGFEYCEIDSKVSTIVASKYISFAKNAQKRKEKYYCGYIQRCLIVLPGNEQCSSAANTFKCDEPKNIDCNNKPRIK